MGMGGNGNVESHSRTSLASACSVSAVSVGALIGLGLQCLSYQFM